MRYPYAVPARPFVQQGHRTLDPAEVEIDDEQRSRLLVYGSNASPEVLARKLTLSADPVLVEPAWLHDFDVVYSAHFSAYGAVPATLQRSPGTTARVAIIHLTAEQLRLVSATEPNYELTALDTATCELHSGEAVTQALRLRQPPRLPAGRRKRGRSRRRARPRPPLRRAGRAPGARAPAPAALPGGEHRRLRPRRRHRPEPGSGPERPARAPAVLDRGLTHPRFGVRITKNFLLLF